MAVPASYNDIGVRKEIHDHIGWVWYEKESVFLFYYKVNEWFFALVRRPIMLKCI